MMNSTSSQFKVNAISVQQEPNVFECGIFAIAFATDAETPVYLFTTRFVHIISKSKCRSLQDKNFYARFRYLLYLPGCIF